MRGPRLRLIAVQLTVALAAGLMAVARADTLLGLWLSAITIPPTLATIAIHTRRQDRGLEMGKVEGAFLFIVLCLACLIPASMIAWWIAVSAVVRAL